MKCINCNQPLLAGTLVCGACGAAQVASGRTGDISTVDPVLLPSFGVEQLQPTTRLKFSVRGEDTELVIDILGELILGRAMPNSPVGFDLTPYGAYINGVSRQHARLQRHQGRLMLSDLTSKNGTFLNGVQLKPGDVLVVRDGDKIRLGNLPIKVFFI